MSQAAPRRQLTRTLSLQPRAATAAATTSSQLLLLLLLPTALPLAADTASRTSAPVLSVLVLAPLPHPVQVVTRALYPMLPKPLPQAAVC